jgi:uncharacterized protein YjbI with pentapeptide repeats
MPHPRKIARSINLDREGYGVDNSLTRGQWQQLCLKQLLSGPEVFNSWQDRLIEIEGANNESHRFEWTVALPNETRADGIHTFGWSDHPSRFVVDISGHVFDELRFFDNYRFRTGVLFVGNFFPAGFHLSQFVSERDFYFIGNEVSGPASIHGAFMRGAMFDYTTFEYHASFSETRFVTALFREVVFCASTHFQGVKFEMVSFDGSQFRGDVDFSGDISSGDHKLQTFGRISFLGVQFLGTVDFSNRKFLHSTNFGKLKNTSTVFAAAPMFHNCELHQNTSFDGVVFAQPTKLDGSAAKAYSTLRHAMSKHQSTRDEQRFQILELDAEKVTENKWVAFLYSSYQRIAGYGFSIVKPAVYLLLFPFLLALAIYGATTGLMNCDAVFTETCQFSPGTFLKVVEFSLLQSLPPLGIEKTTDALRELIFPGEHLGTLLPVMIVQKILSLAGWFFVALALRNLFKMK